MSRRTPKIRVWTGYRTYSLNPWLKIKSSFSHIHHIQDMFHHFSTCIKFSMSFQLKNYTKRHQTSPSDAFSPSHSPPCSTIVSAQIPYPFVGSSTNTWVTAPMSLPFWIKGLPDRSVSRQGQHFFYFFTCYYISLIITILFGMDSLHYFQYFNLMTSCRQLSGNSRIGITPSYSDQTLCLEVSLSETASSPQSSQPLLQPDQNRSNLFSRIGLSLQQHSIK